MVSWNISALATSLLHSPGQAKAIYLQLPASEPFSGWETHTAKRWAYRRYQIVTALGYSPPPSIATEVENCGNMKASSALVPGTPAGRALVAPGGNQLHDSSSTVFFVFPASHPLLVFPGIPFHVKYSHPCLWR